MEIKLTRDNDDEASYTIRLAKVLISILGKPQFKNEDLIKELNDHKGDLTVYWNHKPTTEQKNIVSNAWKEAGELKENIEHIISHKSTNIEVE